MRKRCKSRQTTTVDTMSVAIAEWFGTTQKFSAFDIRMKTNSLTQGEIRGAINHMHNSGLLLREGVNESNGHGLWRLSTRGLVRASVAARRIECKI